MKIKNTISNIINPIIYISFNSDEIALTNLKTNSCYNFKFNSILSKDMINPFNHPRIMLSSIEDAATLIEPMLKKAYGSVRGVRPILIFHPLFKKIEITELEAKGVLEIGAKLLARKVYLYLGDNPIIIDKDIKDILKLPQMIKGNVVGSINNLTVEFDKKMLKRI